MTRGTIVNKKNTQTQKVANGKLLGSMMSSKKHCVLNGVESQIKVRVKVQNYC